MSSAREQRVTRLKRLRTEEELDDPFELPPLKRLNSGTKLHSAAFYDSLSKVWLTPRALKELDRRTSQPNIPQPSPSAGQHIYSEDTWKQIKQFARHGGPALYDLRGYPAPTNDARTMSPSRSSGSRRTKSTVPTTTFSKTKRSSAYDNNFEEHLNNHQIYLRNRKSKPAGLKDIQQRLSQPRPSLSPSRFSDTAFESFRQANEDAIDEGEVMRDVIPAIAGNSDIPSKQNLLFTRLASITDNNTVDAKPDFYDGARLGDIDKKVRDDIRDFIIPTGHATAPVAPNFFLEVKRPSGSADVAKRQACYDGALGARGMHQLQSYGQDQPVYDGNAYTISTTYHSGTLNLYTTHIAESGPGDSPEYHMSLVDGWNLIGNPNTCRQGLTAFRNARDWAQEQRDSLISAANERARSTLADASLLSYPIEVQDTACSTVDEDHVDGARYHMPQPTLDDEGAEPLHTESLTFESSDFHDRLDERDTHHIEEPESSTAELALETFPKPSSNKRRHPSSRTAASKVPRHSNDKTRRGHRSKQ